MSFVKHLNWTVPRPVALPEPPYSVTLKPVAVAIRIEGPNETAVGEVASLLAAKKEEYERPAPRSPFRWTFGDVVYFKILKLRTEKVAGMVTGMFVRPAGNGYYVLWANTGQESGHYEFELTDEFEASFE